MRVRVHDQIDAFASALGERHRCAFREQQAFGDVPVERVVLDHEQ